MRNFHSLLFVMVLGSFSLAGNSESCTGANLELFPAEHIHTGKEKTLHYLTKEPLNIKILKTEFKADSRSVTLTVSDNAKSSIKDLTKKYISKRLAIISKGRLVSSPVINEKIDNNQLQITFANKKDFDLFKLNLNCKK